MNLLLDNSLSPRLAEALAPLSAASGHHVEHQQARFADTDDRVWLAALAREGVWAVLSLERPGKSSLDGAALRETGLTVFILAAGWSDFREWEKAWLLARWWPRLIEQAARNAGGAYRIPASYARRGRLTRLGRRWP